MPQNISDFVATPGRAGPPTRGALGQRVSLSLGAGAHLYSILRVGLPWSWLMLGLALCSRGERLLSRRGRAP